MDTVHKCLQLALEERLRNNKSALLDSRVDDVYEEAYDSENEARAECYKKIIHDIRQDMEKKEKSLGFFEELLKNLGEKPLGLSTHNRCLNCSLKNHCDEIEGCFWDKGTK